MAESRRILGTGSTGAVGSIVVHELLKAGDEPIGYDVSDDFRFMNDVNDRFAFVGGDRLDWPRLQDTVQRYQPQGIIHPAYLLPDLAQANLYMALQVSKRSHAPSRDAAAGLPRGPRRSTPAAWMRDRCRSSTSC
jgi:nucleoside-diphosphate-sugar epimerase